MRDTPKSSLEILQEIALSFKYFRANNDAIFVSMEGSHRSKIVPVKSSEFRAFLIYQLFLKGKTISADSLNTLLDLLSARAKFEAEETETAKRIGKNKSTFYYDLANDAEESVRITSRKYEIVTHSPIVFVRSKTCLSQVKPVFSKTTDVWSLRAYFNTANDDDFTLLLVYILSCFIPEISHHILILLGNQGSAKSTASRIIKNIVDPSLVDVSTMPKNRDDLTLQLSSEYMLVYDNIKTIRPDWNDIFCQVATGGHFIKRELYSDSEIVVYSYKRCLILNGISALTAQPDLLDRSIVITLQKISDCARKTEQEVMQRFRHDLPYILHSIFEIIVHAKKIHASLTVKNLPRMADAVEWQCAISEALGINHQKYLQMYHRNQQCVTDEIVLAHPVALLLTKFLFKKRHWTGSVADLWTKLDHLATIKNVNKNDPLWTKSPSSLSRQLNTLKINLEKSGVQFDIKNTGAHKEITLRYNEGGEDECK